MPSRPARPAGKKPRKRLLTLLVATPLVLILLIAGTGFTAMQFENHDDFCASCHSEPESRYFQRESADAADLASFHGAKNVHCIDCHSGQGLVPGRVSSLMLGAKDLFAWVSNRAVQPAVSTRPIDDVNCLKCHGDITTQGDFNNHFHVLLPRWQLQDKNAATCVSCHQSHHTDGEQPLQFLNRATTMNVCRSCHAILGAG